MKRLTFFGLVLIGIMLLSACEKQGEEIIFSNDEIQKVEAKSRFGKVDGERKLPFKARFLTKRDYSNDGVGYCTEDPFLAFNYQVGQGQTTHLGRFSTVIQFCVAGSDYKNGEGAFVAANGDELYFKVPSEGVIGHILPYEHPFYELQFQDPFTFTGGTGRFEGASGGGMTNSFVDIFDDEGNFIAEHQTDHQWNGTLILP